MKRGTVFLLPSAGAFLHVTDRRQVRVDLRSRRLRSSRLPSLHSSRRLDDYVSFLIEEEERAELSTSSSVAHLASVLLRSSDNPVEDLRSSCLRPLRQGLRVNELKISVPHFLHHFQRTELSKRARLLPVPWCPSGFWLESLEERQEGGLEGELNSKAGSFVSTNSSGGGRIGALGSLLSHQLGLFYIQEPASMLPPTALLQGVGREGTGLHEGLLVLDIAAAPGSKTTQLAASPLLRSRRSLVVANEPATSRVKSLSSNILRCGVGSVALCQSDGESLAVAAGGPSWGLSGRGGLEGEGLFDLVLLDAPCSGEGTIRKNREVLNSWSPSLCDSMASTQRGLMEAAWRVLKPGGRLVYSTCTLNRRENEDVCGHLMEWGNSGKQFCGVRPLSLANLFDGAEQVCTREGYLKVYPHVFDCEGFFVAAFEKTFEGDLKGEGGDRDRLAWMRRNGEAQPSAEGGEADKSSGRGAVEESGREPLEEEHSRTTGGGEEDSDVRGIDVSRKGKRKKKKGRGDSGEQDARKNKKEMRSRSSGGVEKKGSEAFLSRFEVVRNDSGDEGGVYREVVSALESFGVPEEEICRWVEEGRLRVRRGEGRRGFQKSGRGREKGAVGRAEATGGDEQKPSDVWLFPEGWPLMEGSGRLSDGRWSFRRIGVKLFERSPEGKDKSWRGKENGRDGPSSSSSSAFPFSLTHEALQFLGGAGLLRRRLLVANDCQQRGGEVSSGLTLRAVRGEDFRLSDMKDGAAFVVTESGEAVDAVKWVSESAGWREEVLLMHSLSCEADQGQGSAKNVLVPVCKLRVSGRKDAAGNDRKTEDSEMSGRYLKNLMPRDFVFFNIVSD
uniref:SAM-dependent MTase RsmB/NOP-type domain-containing protein n=1 Tax=Chromera velia CCMP2878 TaxID=1169474 RepID=A0A0G4HHL2_9ALVE|eukprot:Cvel_6883.t1-p1 / transcript=Cvel_6883.t1 / gene=Cvel_6883 / organism=Chromera_velia_CCMP2878 / gene_product=Ribosomal RNA small subunit methyltransferase F, putative / transcript_product=Ribosomal RNA small subunit methyltransferase F, putative / location=Cvel_scaffold348:29775-34783(-) / protein_length=840 / sequence_SO=supercontig / SO=protein_coding / is_pseudo=false